MNMKLCPAALFTMLAIYAALFTALFIQCSGQEGILDSLEYDENTSRTKRGDEQMQYQRTYGDLPYHLSSKTITNDVEWKDKNGNILETGRGGKISKIDGVWYWIGHQPSPSGGKWFDGGDIYLYKSTSLGSNSWQFVRKVYEFPEGETTGNCQIHRHPDNGTILVHCKGRKFFISYNGIDGDYQQLDKPLDPSNTPDFKWGSSTVFQVKKNMYLAVSRCDKSSGKCNSRSRTAFIYKLDTSWTTFAPNPIVATWNWPNREAYEIIKKGRWYYLFASETAGWRQSRTWYRRAKSLSKLAKASDKEVMFHPKNTSKIKSMGTQFRIMMKVGRGKWLLGGSRHPDEDPANFDRKYGRNIFAPVRFIRGVPNVFWKSQFNWENYQYKSGEYDEHRHNGFGHGHQPCNTHFENDCKFTAGCDWKTELQSCYSKFIS